MISMRGLRALAGLDHVVPRRPVGSASSSGLPAKQVREEAHVVGVVGDHEEVERARELHRLAAGGGQLLAPGEAVGLLRPEPRAEGACIHRERRVQMRVAEERSRRESRGRHRANTAASATPARSASWIGVPTSWAHADELRPSAIKPVTTERSTASWP